MEGAEEERSPKAEPRKELCYGTATDPRVFTSLSEHSIRVRKRTLSCRVRQAAEGRDLLGDISASQSYRAQLVKVDTRQALLAATEASNSTAYRYKEDL